MSETTDVIGDTVQKAEPAKIVEKWSHTCANNRREKQTKRCIENSLHPSLLRLQKTGKNNTPIVKARKNKSNKERPKHIWRDGMANAAY